MISNYKQKAKLMTTMLQNLLDRTFLLRPPYLIHIIKRKYQIVQASGFNPLRQVPLPYQPKHSLPHWARRLPRIPLQEKLRQRQLEHVLSQKRQPRMPGPHVPGLRPLARRVLERQVQQRVELLRGVIIIIPERLRGFQRVSQSLLRFEQVLVNPQFIRIVEARRRQART